MTDLMLADALGEADVFTDGDWVESKDQDPNGDVRLIQLADVGVGAYLDKSSRFMMSGKAAELKCTYLQPGDVLVARMPEPLGRACVFPGDSKPSVTVVDVCVIRTDPATVDSRWLMHWFNSEGASRAMERSATGTTRKRISRGNLGKLRISLPPIEEQRRIAAVLDAADALRAKRRRALAKLDTLTHAIFIDMFGDLSGPIPANWLELPLGELVAEHKLGLVRGAREQSEDRPWPYVRMNAIGNLGELDLRCLRRVAATSAEVGEYSLETGDLLFNTRNTEELVGKTAIFRANGKYLFNNNILRMRLDNRVNPEYLNTALRTPTLRHELDIRKSGTTSVFAIYFKNLRTVLVPLPPEELQLRFAESTRSVRLNFERAHGSKAALDTLFASLQQRAFRGEL